VRDVDLRQPDEESGVLPAPSCRCEMSEAMLVRRTRVPAAFGRPRAPIEATRWGEIAARVAAHSRWSTFAAPPVATAVNIRRYSVPATVPTAAAMWSSTSAARRHHRPGSVPSAGARSERDAAGGWERCFRWDANLLRRLDAASRVTCTTR
jgi:hypothetical protein